MPSSRLTIAMPITRPSSPASHSIARVRSTADWVLAAARIAFSRCLPTTAIALGTTPPIRLPIARPSASVRLVPQTRRSARRLYLNTPR